MSDLENKEETELDMHEHHHHDGEEHHHDGEEHHHGKCCGHDIEEKHHHNEDEEHHHHDGEEHHHHHEEEHHHHHHDDECGCGHHHEEEHHHHHHDDECGCGCDHDHDHEGHDHDHGHQYKVAGYSLVETHTHEGATVCSFEKETSLSPKEAQAAMKEAFAEIESWLNSEGAIIGHVKGYIRTHGPSYTFSTVGSGVNTGEYEGNGASVGFASIVFGPDEETMKDKVTEIFAGLK